ncbi:MAG TPA: hypothetical protein VG796_22385 [Verrucomicrobiales bacterium]|nr:hypothetical protein [Verrucomicrobiales bacterium]
MFLTLWPIIVIGWGTGAFHHNTVKFRLLLNDALLTRRLHYRSVYGWGLAGGILVLIIAVLSLALAYYTTWWLALLALAANGLMPSWLFEIRARKYYVLHAAEQPA